MIRAATDAPHGETSAEELIIRPIRPDDKARLAEGFDRLSSPSRYRRFLSPHPRLSNAELRYFTEVDHHNHEALVALDPATSRGVGVARYIRSAIESSLAEFAVAVADDWQGRGVGTRLAEALADRAREEGVERFTGLILADNEPMLNLARQLGSVRILHRERGSVELVITLPERGIGMVAGLLRAVAAGHLGAAFSRRGGPEHGMN